MQKEEHYMESMSSSIIAQAEEISDGSAPSENKRIDSVQEDALAAC